MTSPTDPPGPGPRPTDPESGFTLLETLVVVLLLGLVAGIVLQRGPARSPRLDLRAAGSETARTFRLARTRAIAANRPVAVRIDAPARTYALGTDAPHTWPDTVAVTLLATAPGSQGGITGVTFAPDGSSSGAHLVLSQNDRRLAIDVDWLTGRIGVTDAD